MNVLARRFALAAALLALVVLPRASRAEEADTRWGLYAQLAGGAWLTQLSSGDTSVSRYAWVRPGEVLRAEHRLAGTPYVTVETITPGPRPNTLTITTQENDRDRPTRSVVTLHPDGSAVETFVGRNGNPERATYGPLTAGRYSTQTEAQVAGVWREVWSSEITRLQE